MSDVKAIFDGRLEHLVEFSAHIAELQGYYLEHIGAAALVGINGGMKITDIISELHSTTGVDRSTILQVIRKARLEQKEKFGE